ncbi:hypothetical protein D3C81_796560 [compost metagenome]
MTTILALEHKTQIKIFILKVVGYPPYIARVWMSHNHTVIRINHTISIGIHIFWITCLLATIQRSPSINVCLTQYAVLFNDINTIHRLANP